jgi:hypothetical protein
MTALAAALDGLARGLQSLVTWRPAVCGLRHREIDMTATRYALIDLQSGYVWHVCDAVSAESACSIAGINIALTGMLTDDIPQCMSAVIGRWIIRTQDAMPDAMRNGPGWRALLPLAAGTGRDHALERRRSALVVEHMWSVALPMLQPLADQQGFGSEWRSMTTERTAAAAAAATAAAAAAAAEAAAAEAAAAERAVAAAPAAPGSGRW